jgi:hypothetical protein
VGGLTVRITNVSRTAVSDEAGFTESVITFVVTSPVPAVVEEWCCRVNGTAGDPYAGYLAERDTGARVSDPVLGLVGSAVVCGVLADLPDPEGAGFVTPPLTATVHWTEGLVEGTNTVRIYAKDENGEWSP